MATRFRLTASGAPYTPPTRRGAWDNITQASISLMSVTPSGFASNRSQAVGSLTANWDVVIRRFITDPVITAGPLAGTVAWTILCAELASLSTNAFTHMHIYVTAGDTDTVRGVVLTDYIGSTEWTTTMTAYAEGPITLTSVDCQVGDRICAVFGYRASASATTQTGDMRHGGTGADLVAGQTGNLSNPGWIEFSGADALFTEAPPAPAEVLDIGSAEGQNHFKLQLARPSDGAFTTVSLAALEAGFTEAPYFHTTGAGGQRVHFEAQLNAPTTPGSSFSRCELREVDASGADFSWNPATGEHVMEGITVITSLPPVKPEVVIAQVFDEVGGADLCSIRTQLVSDTTRLRFRFLGTSVTSPQIASAYATGEYLAWKLRLVNGVVEVYWEYNGSLSLPATPQITTAAVPAGLTAYFKAGLYNGSNVAAGDAGTAIGASELSGLSVAHTMPDPAAASAFMTFFGGV